ncbi:MAG TPA: UDP-N-acetylmuramoyl-L-alanine--D-glutamate ligase [Oscillatoriaceae cyanobacterium]
MDWQNKKITILGLGRSGLASARALAELGALLCLSDSKPDAEIEAMVADLPRERVRIEGGGHSLASLDAEMLVLSPGVPVDLPIVQAAIADGVQVIGEIELAYLLRHDVPYVAITGTNGKTTTTTLVGELLNGCGMRAPVGGNIGVPLVDLVKAPADALVAEVSSFQLETIATFRPRVAAFLNFTDDHLNRHGTREVYWAMKCRIFENQTPDDTAVLNADDPAVASLEGKLKSRVILFSAVRPLAEGVVVENEWIVYRTASGPTPVMPVAEIQLRGRHNLENCLAGVAVAAALGLPFEGVRRVIAGFKAVEHRIEPVATVGGALFVNDSKGTNYDATVKAIEAFDEPLVLIAGGRDKGGAIDPLVEAIAKRVKHTVLVGEAAPYFERVLRAAGYSALTLADGFEAGVRAALDQAGTGDVVLFSPACTSFDMFKNYEERGRVYKSIVHQLAGQPAQQ